jgi:hypothetical protein
VAGGTIVMKLSDQEDSKKELILDQEEVWFAEEIIDVEQCKHTIANQTYLSSIMKTIHPI